MAQPKSILLTLDGPVATLTLNRPHVHHAMDLAMIRELTEAFIRLENNPLCRIAVITSQGKHFSAGADLNWMREGLHQSAEQLKKESLELAHLFKTMSESGLVVVSVIWGKVLGGATGLVAASDIALAQHDTEFAFSEVKLGLVPATIAPYVIRKVGYSRTSEWMITGRSFGAEEARMAGLIHHIYSQEELDGRLQNLLQQLKSNGPEAMRGIKQLLFQLTSATDPKEIPGLTAEVIARHRISPEGQEGIKAFFEKRKADWNDLS